jgi:hypothetical protein
MSNVTVAVIKKAFKEESGFQPSHVSFLNDGTALIVIKVPRDMSAVEFEGLASGIYQSLVEAFQDRYRARASRVYLYSYEIRITG